MQISSQHSKGFTLLEVVLAVGIIALLSGSIVAISASTLSLTSTLINEQELRIQSDVVESHIRRNFSTILNDSSIELTIGGSESSTGGTFVSSVSGTQALRITNPSVYFPLDGFDTLASETVLTTTLNEEGYLDLIQVYISNPNTSGESDIFTITLLSNLKSISWHFFQPDIQDWVTEWTEQTNNPSQIRFSYQKLDETPENLFIWVLQ